MLVLLILHRGFVCVLGNLSFGAKEIDVVLQRLNLTFEEETKVPVHGDVELLRDLNPNMYLMGSVCTVKPVNVR